MEKGGLLTALGNPGEKFAFSRHNCGFMFAEKLLQIVKEEGGIKEISGKNFYSKIWEITSPLFKNKWLLAEPQTFMNDSGKAVSHIMDYFHISSDNVIVIQDELDISPGQIRFKFGGGCAGHRGLLSIVDHIHTKNFWRLRIGIGKPEDRQEIINWVLGHLDDATREVIQKSILEAIKTFFIFTNSGYQDAIHYARSINLSANKNFSKF